MNKPTTPIIAFILALALTAYDKTATSPETSSPTTPPPTDTTSSAESETSDTSVKKEETEEKDEGIYIDYLGVKIDVSEYKHDDMYYGSYEDYTYARKSTGISFNSIDNPDFYDPETMELKVDYPEVKPIEKVKIGDKFGTLTVTKTQFYFQRGIGGDNNIWQECASIVDYEGDITFKGYVSVTTVAEGYSEKGDISFLPDSVFFKDIPFPVNANTQPLFYYYNNGDLIIYSDSPYMSLGSLYDEAYAKIDLSAIPNDGTAKHIEITLTGLHFISNDQTGSHYEATIVKCN